MKSIQEQIVAFFAHTTVSQAALARQSHVHEVFISRLRSGKSKDVWSKKADALREAMLWLDYQSARKAGVDV